LRAHLPLQARDRLTGEITVAVEERKRALLCRECRRGEIGLALDRAEPAFGRRDCRRRAIPQPAEDQRIGEARDPEADAALLARLFLLPG